jgi:hypothetical protein
LEHDIASEKGEFSLFALFLREDADDTWDLLASAPWLEANNRESLDYLVNQLRSRLDTQELLSLSRIVLLEKGGSFQIPVDSFSAPLVVIGWQAQP